MATYVIGGYSAAAIEVQGGGALGTGQVFKLASGFTAGSASALNITITDDDTAFAGSSASALDAGQTAVVTTGTGAAVASGVIRLGLGYSYSDPTLGAATLYQVYVGSTLVGYVTTAQLTPGVMQTVSAQADTTATGVAYSSIAAVTYDQTANNTVVGGAGNDSILGGAGNDSLSANAGNDTIFGGAGDDSLSGGTGTDSLFGDDGNDWFFVTDATGSDIIAGGAGNDSISFASATRGVNVLFSGTGAGSQNFSGLTAYTFATVEGVSGTEQADTLNATLDTVGVWFAGNGGADTLTGGSGGDILLGGAGNDSLTGNNGNDQLSGGDGNDILLGGAGNDTIEGGAGNDSYSGGNNDDVFIIGDTAGVDTLAGGLETAIATGDLIDATAQTTGATVTFSAAETGSIVQSGTTSGFTDIERLWLGSGNDTLTGGAGNESVDGGGGADALSGGAGADTLAGGAGNDTITGGTGADSLSGDAGDDRFVFAAADGADTISGGEGGETTGDVLDNSTSAVNTTLTFTGAEAGTLTNASNTLTFSAIERILLGAGNDTLTGASGNDNLDAGAGNDSLSGLGGNDTLAGGAGQDTLLGGSGNDTLSGGDGNDQLTGDGDILVNGSLEAGVAANGWSATAVSGWNSNTGTIEVWGSGLNGETAVDGSNFIEIDNDYTVDQIWQDVQTVAGESYSLSFSLQQRDTGTDSVEVWWRGALLTTITPGTAWQVYSFDVTGSGGTDRLEFRELSTQNNSLGPLLDNVRLVSGGADSLDGGAGNDTLTGGNGADSLQGGAGNDSITAGGGDDVIQLGAGFGIDTIDAGSTTETAGDLLDATGMSANATLTLTGDGIGTLTDGTNTATLTDLERFWLGAGNDSATGGAFNDSIDGGAGNDSLYGNAGNDTLAGGTGNDYLAGGAGNDIYYGGSGNDQTANDDEGDDLFYAGAGDDTFGGGVGNDTLYGEDGNDALEGSDGQDVIFGGAGDDYIAGFDVSGLTATAPTKSLTPTVQSDDGAADSLSGDAGNDILFGGGGADTLDGGADNDILLGGTGDDLLSGGTGNDSLTGDAGSDSLSGGDGADTLEGGAEADSLSGDAGADLLSGGDGNDTLAGGAGNDSLTGGAGRDTYSLQSGFGRDVITDFNTTLTGLQTIDRLDVSGLLDAQGNPVNWADVVVGDDGAGNALLTFPNGEQIVLMGVAPAAVTGKHHLARIGVPCFAAGTLIATPDGERPIESLQQGDSVLTLDHSPQPILWTGHRHLDRETLDANPEHRPIVLRAGAMGNPRDLVLSPQHALLVDTPDGIKLARAKHLADLGDGRFRVARGKREVTYHHLLLPRHDLVIANGIPAESLYPGPMAVLALGSAAVAEIAAILPDLGPVMAGLVDAAAVYGPTIRPVAKRRELKLAGWRAAHAA